MHLKQPGFTYGFACGSFTKNKERFHKFKETEGISYIYKNERDKACFQHEMAYGDFKDLKRRTFSDKVLREKAFNIAKNPKYDGYQRRLVSMVINFLVKSPHVVALMNNQLKNCTNQLLETLKKTSSFWV